MHHSKFPAAIATLLMAATVANANTVEDLWSMAKKHGVNLSNPVTITFEWRAPSELKEAKALLATFQAAGFTVKNTQVSRSAAKEYRTEATLANTVVNRTQIDQLVTRVESLTSQDGHAKWLIKQVQ